MPNQSTYHLFSSHLGLKHKNTILVFALRTHQIVEELPEKVINEIQLMRTVVVILDAQSDLTALPVLACDVATVAEVVGDAVQGYVDEGHEKKLRETDSDVVLVEEVLRVLLVDVDLLVQFAFFGRNILVNGAASFGALNLNVISVELVWGLLVVLFDENELENALEGDGEGEKQQDSSKRLPETEENQGQGGEEARHKVHDIPFFLVALENRVPLNAGDQFEEAAEAGRENACFVKLAIIYR